MLRGGPGLRRHGESTPFDSVELVERWERNARDQAEAEAVGLRRTPGARRRLGRWLWRATFDPDREIPKSITRRFPDRSGEPDRARRLVTQTSQSLAECFGQALDTDANRFRSLLGGVTTLGEVAALEDAIESLVSAMLSPEVAGTAGSSQESETGSPRIVEDLTVGREPAHNGAGGSS